MRKHVFCIYENKGADQLRGNHAADQRLCFRSGYIVSIIPLLRKFDISQFTFLAIFCGCTVWIVSDLVGTPKTGFLMKRLICNKMLEHLLRSLTKILE